MPEIPTAITYDQLFEMLTAATAAGDVAFADICRLALHGNDSARETCLKVLLASRYTHRGDRGFTPASRTPR